MKKYMLVAGFGFLAFYGFTYFFKSEVFVKYSKTNVETEKNSGALQRWIASDESKEVDKTTEHHSTDAKKMNDTSPEDVKANAKNEEGPASTFPKYYNVKIKDKYDPAPKYIMDALAKEEKKMKEITQKAQVEGDELVMCHSRLPKCVGGSNEALNCITQQRNCDETSQPKKLTDSDLINVMGRNSFEKYRNHLEFIGKTGTSIRGPGSLEKF